MGRVRIAGSTPLEQVLVEPRIEGGRPFEVRGPLRSELLRLSGATVRATGNPENGSLRVTAYEILEIADRKPVVGILRRGANGFWIRTEVGEEVRLREVPSALQAQTGGRVWVILDAQGAVKGYGILREG